MTPAARSLFFVYLGILCITMQPASAGIVSTYESQIATYRFFESKDFEKTYSDPNAICEGQMPEIIFAGRSDQLEHYRAKSNLPLSPDEVLEINQTARRIGETIAKDKSLPFVVDPGRNHSEFTNLALNHKDFGSWGTLAFQFRSNGNAMTAYFLADYKTGQYKIMPRQLSRLNWGESIILEFCFPKDQPFLVAKLLRNANYESNSSFQYLLISFSSGELQMNFESKIKTGVISPDTKVLFNKERNKLTIGQIQHQGIFEGTTYECSGGGNMGFGFHFYTGGSTQLALSEINLNNFTASEKEPQKIAEFSALPQYRRTVQRSFSSCDDQNIYLNLRRLPNYPYALINLYQGPRSLP